MPPQAQGHYLNHLDRLCTGPCIQLLYRPSDEDAGPNQEQAQASYPIFPYPVPVRLVENFCEGLRGEVAPNQAPDTNAGEAATHHIGGLKSLLGGYQEVVIAIVDWSQGYHYPDPAPRFPSLSYSKTARVHHVSTLLQFHHFIAEAESRLRGLLLSRPLYEAEAILLIRRSGVPQDHLAIRLVAAKLADNILRARRELHPDRRAIGRNLERMCERLGEDFAHRVQTATRRMQLGDAVAAGAPPGNFVHYGDDDNDEAYEEEGAGGVFQDHAWPGGGRDRHFDMSQVRYRGRGYRMYPYAPPGSSATGIRSRTDSSGMRHKEFVRPVRASSGGSGCVVL